MIATNSQTPFLSLVVPTKDRVRILAELLESIRQLEKLEELQPEVIVAENGSNDGTVDYVNSLVRAFPVALRVVQIQRPGKSAALNEAVRAAAKGAFLAFLDDDVAVDTRWLIAVDDFVRNHAYSVGQGVIRLPAPANDDPKTLKLVERYRTIPRLEHGRKIETVHSLNGANFFITRGAFDRVGGFDERLGPGASGTSEDVDLARRLGRAGIAIGYVPEAIVHHRIDVQRLSETYFKESHRRQGVSRLLMRDHPTAVILLNLARAVAQFGFYSLVRKERQRYRSKGRIYHYLGMVETKRSRIERRRSQSAEVTDFS